MRELHTLAVAVLMVTAAAVPAADYSHKEYFEHYEGTATCLECHEDEANAFFSSQHYQWRGETPQVVNSGGERLGKMDMVNDFCTNPVPNWIGKEYNPDGKVLARGCSSCHAGLGKKPTAEISREQLENMDCLICHASGYRKDVYQKDDGSWEWRSILWKNQEGLDSVSKRISLPTRKMCLRCHSASGGGPNYKRGDIEYVLRDCEPEHDVHMASEGNDMNCIDCHGGDDHRVVGRGSDLAGSDTTSRRLSCGDGECHDRSPHARELINRHAVRVDCTVCHIPAFARDEPTDMLRDWSDTHFDEEKGKHAPRIDLESDVVPTYAWFNGNSKLQLPGEPVEHAADGSVMMAAPEGSRDDPEARIYPFKVHRGRLPVLEDKHWLVPITTEEFYVHGDMDRAVREAAEVYYGIHEADFEWQDTTRYMGIYHGVQPAEYALRCLDCHGSDSRLDWKDLGYESDPLAACLEPSH